MNQRRRIIAAALRKFAPTRVKFEGKKNNSNPMPVFNQQRFALDSQSGFMNHEPEPYSCCSPAGRAAGSDDT